MSIPIITSYLLLRNCKEPWTSLPSQNIVFKFRVKYFSLLFCQQHLDFLRSISALKEIIFTYVDVQYKLSQIICHEDLFAEENMTLGEPISHYRGRTTRSADEKVIYINERTCLDHREKSSGVIIVSLIMSACFFRRNQKPIWPCLTLSNILSKNHEELYQILWKR